MLVEFCNPDRRNRWENAAGLGVYPQPGGRFEIRGSDGGRQLRLRPRAWGFLPAPALPFAPGDKNLEVRLYRGGYLRAVVLHDQVVSGAEIDVRLRAVAIDRAIDDALSWRFVGRVDKRGSGNLMLRKAYWWSGLPPGEFRLELRLLGASQPFMVREHLRPQFGSDRVEDLPFEVLNLRGQIHRVTVRAVDSRQRPLAGLAIPLDQTTLVGVEGVKMAGKGAVLYSTNALQNVLVVVRGYRPEKVFGISGEHVVRLQPGIPITVNLPSISLPAGLGLAVQIRRRDYRPAETYRVGLRHPVVERAGARYLADLVGERSITLRYRGRRQWKTTLMEHGQFVLDLHLVRKGKPPVRLPGYGPRVLMVRDTSVEHEFGIKVNGKRLREAIEQMGLQPPPPRGAGKQRKARGAGGKAQRAGNGSGPKK
jgi:hypothetical protein